MVTTLSTTPRGRSAMPGPGTFRVQLLAVMAVLSLLLAGLTTVLPAQPAHAAGAPGEFVSLVSGDNTFSYRLSVVADGTGHNQPETSCYINAENGYHPGDEGPDDGYVCKGDSILYRVDWNAEIYDLGTAQIAFGMNSYAETNRYTLMLTGEAGHQNMWHWQSGVTGGAGAGFVGNAVGHSGSVQFTQTGPFSGYYIFSYTPNEGWPSRMLAGGDLLMGMRATMGGATDTALADRSVQVLAHTRADITHRTPVVDGGATTVGGVSYRGISTWSDLGQNATPRPATSNRPWPGWDQNKGYYSAGLDTWDWSLSYQQRFSMLDAPAGTLVSVDGAEPVPAPIDTDGSAFVTADARSVVKWLVPWGSLPTPGNYTFDTRIDLLDLLYTDDGFVNLQGVADPGVGLSCGTTTQGVLPGTLAGERRLNNNCSTVTIDKRGYGDVFDKTDYTRPATMGDGTRVGAIATGPGQDGAANWGSTGRIEARHTVSPQPGDHDLAFCSVWDGDELRLESAMPRVGSQSLVQAFPTARVYYTTQDLRPVGAPDVEEPPLCGSPSDTSIWTDVPPAGTNHHTEEYRAVSGVMVVIPGVETLVQPVRIDVLLLTEYGELFENLITENVRNYMGFSRDTSVEEPVWRVDSDHFSVGKSRIEARSSYENGNTIGTGAFTYRTQVDAMFLHHGYMEPGTTLVQRVYLDRCMSSPTIVVPAGTAPRLHSWQVVGQPDPQAGCGTSSDYYAEMLWDVPAGGGTRFFIEWTTPAWSAPGDEYRLNSVYSRVPGSEQIFALSGNPTAKNYQARSANVISGVKATEDPLVEVDTPFTHTVGWLNYSEDPAGRTQFIDVLPYDGDENGSSFTGAFWLTGIEQVFGVTGITSYEFTSADPADIDDDPADASNQPGGSTTWCSEADLGSAGCPADITETTAIRFTSSDFPVGARQYFDLNFDAAGNSGDDIYINQLSVGRAAELGAELPSPNPVQTVVVDSSISGTVFLDTDRSTALDSGESGLAGYTVLLLDASSGTVIGSTVTDEDGDYIFAGLRSGDYQVQVVNDGPYPVITVVGNDTGDDAQDATTQVIGLGVDTDVTDVDAGLWAPATISGTVYEDLDASGSGAGLEPGVPGVTVELLDPDGDAAASMSTGPDGTYAFTGLDAGSWTVRMTTPDGRWVTQVWTVSDPTGVAGTELAAVAGGIALSLGGSQSQVDFGLFEPAGLSGTVYEDLDASGSLTDGDATQPGQDVTLTLPDTTTVTTTTGEDGFYEFTGLTPGTYTVTWTAPDRTVVTQVWTVSDPAGIDPGDGDAHRTAQIVLAGGVTVTDVDLGYLSLGPNPLVLHKTVDLATARPGDTLTWTITVENPSGYDREIAGVTDVLPAGVTWSGSAWNHAADVVEPGEGGYVLDVTFDPVVVVPAGSTVTLGTVVATVDADAPAGGTLVNGASGTDPDGTVLGPDGSCENPQLPVTGVTVTTCAVTDLSTVTLSGTVYADTDDDGTQGGTETGIAGWDVTLTLPDGTTAVTTTTDEDGSYEFTGLVAGGHLVTITDPATGRLLTQSYTVADPWGQDTDTTQGATVLATDVTGVDWGLFDPVPVTVEKWGSGGLLPGTTFVLSGPFVPGHGEDAVVELAPDAPADGLHVTPGLVLNTTYELVETRTADGHSLLAEPVGFMLTVDGLVLVSGTSQNVQVAGDDPWTVQLANDPAVQLPRTGGGGVTPALPAAALLLLAAGLAGLARSRSREAGMS